MHYNTQNQIVNIFLTKNINGRYQNPFIHYFLCITRFVFNPDLTTKKGPAGLAGGSSCTPIRLFYQLPPKGRTTI